MPVRVPAATISSAAPAIVFLPDNDGPNQRRVSVSARSTAKTNTGTSRVDSRSQDSNGVWVRSIAPTAPRSETTQKPSAYAMTTASGITVSHGTADRAAGAAGCSSTGRATWLVMA
jgi:hypothetical protein